MEQTFMAFRDDILTYLGSEKDIILNEQDTQANLSIEEKIEKGILIKNAELIKIDSDNNQAFFKCIENNSKR